MAEFWDRACVSCGVQLEAFGGLRGAPRKRRVVTFLVILSFFFQSYITQTHIHPSPVELRTAQQVRNTKGLLQTASSRSQSKKLPDKDDPAHCPLCQAVADTGSFAIPMAPMLAVPTATAAFKTTVQHPAPHVAILPHDWQGRAPPAI